MSTLQSRAAALAARIRSLGAQEEALAEKFDQAQSQVETLRQQVTAAKAQLAVAQANTEKARRALKADVIQAYVNGGNDPLNSGSNVESATNSLLRAEYINTLATNQNEAIDQYRLASLQEQAAASRLKAQQSAAQTELDTVTADRTAVVASDRQLTGQETQVNQEIAQLKAEELAAEQRAAAAAAAKRVAEAAQAAAEARALAAEAAQLQNGGANGITVSYTVPPSSSGAAGAVRAAESRLGDWYQWGAAGPNTFDCSGLVMWSYAQVGISLPHYSGSQYDQTTHIPMSDLQPGDLVFFSDPGEHVAMYVVGGDIIEAPHTGTQVHIVPMYSGFTLAGRVA